MEKISLDCDDNSQNDDGDLAHVFEGFGVAADGAAILLSPQINLEIKE